MKRILLVALCMSLTAYYSIAQTKPAVLPDVFPPAPDAAALAKYGEVPVSLFTGVPNISIPMFDIKTKRLSLSVGLSYHAGGNKVEDQASNVGLGWSLMAGGAITRSMRGLPDELNNGYFNGAPSVLSVPTDLQKSRNAADGLIDTQPDLFSFNFGPYSGTFYFDQAGVIHSSFLNKFVIKQPFAVAQNPTSDGSWSIITEDGTQYLFESTATEIQTSSNLCNSGATISMSLRPIPAYISTWHLTKIISADLSDQIVFQYGGPTNVTYKPLGSETKYIRDNDGGGNNPAAPGASHTYCDNQIQTGTRILGRITFTNGFIDFDYGLATTRTDLPGASILKRVGLYDTQNNQIKEFVLEQDYFVYETGLTKLKLTKVQEQRSDFNPQLTFPRPAGIVSASLPPYSFVYFDKTSSLNSHNRYAQDHWGFYNGIDNPLGTFIPEREIVYSNNMKAFFPGANRNPTLTGSQTFVLNRINYPTGGYSDFTYELHDAVEPDLPYANKALPVTVSVSDNNPTPKEFVINSYSSDPAYKTFISMRATTPSCGQVGASPDGCGASNFSSNCAQIIIEKCTGTIPVFPPSPFPTTQCANWSTVTTITGYFDNLFCPSSFGLPDGRYRVRVVTPTGGNYTVSLSYYEKDVDFAADGSVLPNKRVGGLRIKKIISATSSSDPAPTVKQYSYRQSDGKSSGSVLSIPIYSYRTIVYNSFTDATVNQTYSGTFGYIVNSSFSNVTLGTAAGNAVSYTAVTVQQGENAENGKETHIFSYTTDAVNSVFPFGPSTTYDYLRGLELGKTIYRKDNSTFSLVDDIQTSYKTNAYTPTGTPGLKVGYAVEGWNTGTQSDMLSNYAYSRFTEQTNWLYQETSKHRVYESGSGNYTESQQANAYGLNHLQLTKQTRTNSDGTVYSTELKYPADYPTATGALAEMKGSRNMQNALVEKLDKVQRSGDSEKLLQGTLNTYATITSTGSPAVSRVVLQSVSQTELSSPSTAAPVYVEQQAFSYDNSANMIEAKRKGDRYTSYVWGYNAALPIAEIQNATASEVQTKLGSESSIAALTDPTSIRSTINALRSQLPYSLITCYTYFPHIGTQSTTTPANLTTYYEYDPFMRLKRIFDNKSQVVKEYVYSYK